MVALDGQVNSVLYEYINDNISKVAAHMSLMDRSYALLANDINASSQIVRNTQHKFYIEQAKLAE